MRVFVTGASGWIGSAVVPELIAAGHSVLGLARSDTSAAAVTALGAEVHRGSIDDPASLLAGARAADGVVHLAYDHDFSQMERAAKTDLAAIEALGEALAGTGAPLVFASGALGVAHGRTATEHDTPDPAVHPRAATATAALALADRGLRPVSMRFAPTVHGPGDAGFVAVLVAIAREKGVSGYVADGSTRWPAVHRLDAATLVRLAVDDANSGPVLHAVAEEGVPTREIAESIGRALGVPAVSVPAEQAGEHFGWLGMFLAIDSPTSNTVTRERTGWAPTHPGLLADIDAGSYTTAG